MDLFKDMLAGVFFLMVFGAVLFLAIVFTKYIGKKANKAMKGKYINLVESINLGLDKRLMLVKVADQYVLIASSGKSMEYITTVRIDDFNEDLSQQNENVFDFKGIFDKYVQSFKSIRTIKSKKQDDKTVNNNADAVMEDVFKSNLNRLRTMTMKSIKQETEVEEETTDDK